MNWTCVSRIGKWFLYHWATSEAYSRLGSSLHQFCPHLFGQDSVTWCHLNAREAGKCSQAMCPGVKDLGADSAIHDERICQTSAWKYPDTQRCQLFGRSWWHWILFQMHCQVLFRYYLPGPQLWPVKLSKFGPMGKYNSSFFLFGKQKNLFLLDTVVEIHVSNISSLQDFQTKELWVNLQTFFFVLFCYFGSAG